MSNGRAMNLGRRRGLGPGVKWLLIANGVAYLLSLLYIFQVAPKETLKGIDHLMLHPQAVMEGEIWQIGTYMFLHDFLDPMHILFNMFILWMFGGIFEPQWGTRRFVFFYLACGLGAGVVSVAAGALFPSVGFLNTYILGASGAVLGFVVAFGVFYPRQYVMLYFLVPIQARFIAIGVAVGDLLWNFLFDSKVASQAHLGGMLTAYLLLTGYWRPSRLKTLKAKMDARKRQKEMRRRFFDSQTKH